MSAWTRRFLCIGLLLVGLAWPQGARAVPPEHETGDSCGTCHSQHSASYPVLLGELCEGCHFEGGPARAVETHSSLSTGTTYGNWHVDCWGCHDPHRQQQELIWGSTYGKMLRVFLTATGTWDGALAPTPTDIIEIDPLDPGPFYEPLSILRTITSSNVEHTSPNTFVDGDAEFSDDICQVCHEQTLYYEPIGAFNYHADYGVDTQPAGDCIQCHAHDSGFAPSDCTDCHAQAQGDPTLYRRQIVGVGGDFERTSHHVSDGSATEIMQDEDCAVCHDQLNHQSIVDPNVLLNDPDGGASHTYDGGGASVENFCLNCHDADGSLAFDSDADNSDGYQPFSAGWDPTDIKTHWVSASHNSLLPTALGDEACMACHGGPDSTRTGQSADRNAHGSDHGSLLSDIVAGIAVTNSEEDLCYACHDGVIASTNLTVDFAKAIRHPISDADQAAVPTAGRTSECVDCHNAHGATGGSHNYGSTATASRNQVSPALVGASGVAVDYTGLGNFVVPAIGDYTLQEATYEYEICFKCHTNYDWGATPPNGLSPNGSVANPVETNLAQDFNPANAAFHPVVVGLDHASSGSTSLKNAQLTATWSSNIGTQTMMCSDCHNTDASSPAAQGPHGSAVAFMLRGPNTVWPPTANLDGSPELETAYNGSFCSNCHTYTRDNEAHDNHDDVGDASEFNLYCYSCHIVVPHGGKLARLIGDRNSMPARYAYNNNLSTMQVQAFRKRGDYSNYQEQDCQAACHTVHDQDPGAQYHW